MTIFAARAWGAGGGLDHTFSGDGRKTTAFGNGTASERANAVAIQTNDRIVVVGLAVPGGTTSYDFALARYNQNGSLDHSFSGDGRTATAFDNGAGHDVAGAVAIQANGKIVVAGSSDQGGASGRDFALARYNQNGSLDHSFSGDGRKTTAFGNGAGYDVASAVAIQANGKIVVAGSSDQGGASGSDFALARYNPNGSLDQSFSGDGRKITAFGNGASLEVATAVAIQTNGRIVMVGGSDPGGTTGYDFALARFNPNGGFDHSFSGNGRKTTAFANGPGEDYANGVAIQANGKIVLAGYSDQGGSGDDFALARYSPNGSLDHSFSGDGRKTTGFGNGASFEIASGVAIQGNGRIVVAGYADLGGTTGTDFALARYNQNGGLDHSFSGNGRKTTAFANGPGEDYANGVAIQANGKIVLAGYSDQGGSTGTDFAVARYLP